MAASVFMSGAVTGNANLMEKIKRLARDNSFQPETPQHLGLGLFGRYIDASPGGSVAKFDFLGKIQKIESQEFNGLQTLKRSKKQLCDRTSRAMTTRLWVS